MDISHTVHISATPEKLWHTLTVFDEMQKWTSSLISEEVISSGDPGPGFISKMTILEGGKAVIYDSEIVTYEPTTRLGIILRGGSLGNGPMSVDYTLTPTDDSTRVDYRTQWQPQGILLKLMSPMITKMSRKNVQAQMANLKIVAER